MDELRRNAMIGLFLVVGLAAMTWLVIMFGEAPAWLIGGKTYPVYAYFSNVANVIEGDPVYMKGVRVGHIGTIGFRNEEHPEEGVQLELAVQEKWRVPRSAHVLVELSAMGFARPLVKIIVPPVLTDEFLPMDGTVPLSGEMVSAFDSLFPQDVVATLQKSASQIGNFAEALTPVANDLHDMLQPRDIQRVDDPEIEAQRLSANLHTAVQRMDAALRHFNQVLGDPNVQSNVRVAIRNFREVSEQGKAVMDDLKHVAKQARFVAEDTKELTGKMNKMVDKANAQLDNVTRAIIDPAEKLGKFFDHLDVVGRNLAEGKGTAGKMLADPELYESMVLTMKRLQLAIEDLGALVKEWQREGLNVKGVGWKLQ